LDVIEAIETRRSIGRLREDEPPRQLIELLLNAAVQAPNHHETQPWRFVVLTGRARSELGKAMAEALRARTPEQDESRLQALCDAELAKPLRAPVLIAVGVKHDQNERILPVEDLQACSAAIQNLLLAAHASGLGAQWRTGSGAYDPAIKAYLGFAPADEIAGFVYVGYPREGFESRLKSRQRSHQALTEWRIEA
jgi:nitroreductase